ncbi:MAG: phosphatidylserine/phosphatidylglycerophosphate/cardiolipin synthase family protein [Parachlamydiaceae bacterium]|nr:phosphatidylserine/phosphatidylglycerophosphate/cardiolipin synthase family protein [Parachlamydiaceae bacterium]
MGKNKSILKASPFPFIKKTTITSIIGFFCFVLYRMSEPAFASNLLPATDKPIQMYSNQTKDDLTSIFTQAIRESNQSVTMVIYSLLDQQIIGALKEKCESGVPVYIVCDAKASPGISSKLPQAQIVRRAGKGLTHQKILIIDDRQIWVGSANMTRDSLQVHGNLIVGMDHPELAEAVVEKIKDMDESANSKNPFLHHKTNVGGQNVEFWILPDDNNGVKRMLQLFKSAKKSIKVAMFTWTRVDFTQELIRASLRGVKVEAVLDRCSAKGASEKIVELLKGANISVRLSNGKGLLHHKFVYIDDQILVNGSANWTNSAFRVNDDCFLVIYPLLPEQKKKMNSLWNVIQKESVTVPVSG